MGGGERRGVCGKGWGWVVVDVGGGWRMVWNGESFEVVGMVLHGGLGCGWCQEHCLAILSHQKRLLPLPLR